MKMLNLFGKSVVSVAVVAACFGANAAQNGRVGMMGASTSARMPTMPVVGLTTIGNTAVTIIDQPVETNFAQPIVTPQPQPQPQPTPSGCADGGVKNSEYTITMCMDDILQCVNTGALQGGLNDLFNEDVRNSIMNGMKLCQTQVDKCISSVRVDCHNVYAQSSDVWLDFNSRIVQPEYYNFVLRKTGLTPNQAENTCLLLDRNTYGSSFSAISDTNAVNGEYSNKVGAYNEALNGTLSKDNPQGVAVNTVGYDGNRGHYARWDASKAECLVRVAAYNKDKLITNSWLFGAVGNDNPAEVWEKAGSTFTCSKELFDFDSLLNDTKTAAVIAVPGGAVLGTAIGAGAGAGVAAKKQDAYDELRKGGKCSDPEYRAELGRAIEASEKKNILRRYMYTDVKYNSEAEENSKMFTGDAVFEDKTSFYELEEDECQAILDLKAKIAEYEYDISQCNTPSYQKVLKVISNTVGDDFITKKLDYEATEDAVTKITLTTTVSNPIECPLEDVKITETEMKNFKSCLFVPLDLGGILFIADNPRCEHEGGCMSIPAIQRQIDAIKSLYRTLDKVVAEEPEAVNKGKEIGKGAGIGLATGAAAGGLATAITAFVEKSNITCKVGDGLNSVALGKSHTIDSLKDFYVKWNLHLPDTVSPTSAVVDKTSWEQACGQFNNKLADCPKVQINLKDVSGKYTLIPSACKVSGSICIINDSVATSHGI